MNNPICYVKNKKKMGFPFPLTTNQLVYVTILKKEKNSKQERKQDRELTVAQIRNSLLPNSDLN